VKRKKREDMLLGRRSGGVANAGR